MQAQIKWKALVAITALGACGGNPPPVTVLGRTADIRGLIGSWVGDYSSPLTGRSGTIVFELQAGGDSAWGHVVMTARGAAGPLMPWQNPRAPTMTATELTIRFVRVVNDEVSGSLTPYADPTTGEPRYTVFEGRLVGDTIAGTYTTRPAGPGEPTGRWRVERGH